MNFSLFDYGENWGQYKGRAGEVDFRKGLREEVLREPASRKEKQR